jgi:hypothetical protein
MLNANRAAAALNILFEVRRHNGKKLPKPKELVPSDKRLLWNGEGSNGWMSKA